MRYRVLDRIGVGGMAEVFRATALGSRGFERTFVIKRILPRLASTPEFLRMFVDEAKISALLSHPNIVQVFAFAETDGIPLLVMEHVDGCDLGEVLRVLGARGVAMPPAVAAEIARQCCLALDYAHRLTDSDGKPLGIVHRDVTPSNIMVSWEGAVKLLDFGIARAVPGVRTSHTTTGMMKGKFGYVAPEQIAGGAVDHRADLFALGAVLHEALSNRRLFAGDSDLGTLKNLMEMTVAPPSRLNPAVGRSLDRIVMRALRRDPAERFATAGQMAAELETYLQRGRTSSTIVRAFMTELHGADAAARGPGRPLPGQGPGTIILDDVEVLAAGSAPARPTAAGAAAVGGGGPPALPPPLPLRRSRGWARAYTGLTRRFWLTSRPRRAFVALGVAAAVLVLIERGRASRPGTDGAPAPAVAEEREEAREADDARVEITLDSIPQGAQVAREADGTSVAGETPLVLELPRGRVPVAVWIRKDGYEPLVFKIIPNQSHAAMVTLRRGGRPTKTASLDQDTH
jgi:hypothetical protein